MLNVFILEDDPIQLQQMKNNIEKIGANLDIEVDCKIFADIDDLRKSLPQPSRSNVFILDLEINGIKNAGLEFSKKIRAHDQLASLIFITVHDEFLYRTYKYRVSALDFIAKDYSDIYAELQKDIQQVQTQLQASNNEKPFVYKDYSNIIKIDFMNINYFESNSSNSHSSILNTVNNQQRQLNHNLRDIEKMDHRFFRAHRSYLVNLRQIDHVDPRKGIIYFYNGETCPVSKLHIRHILKLIN
ncbi:response regulator transcription factor [Limosilactobacillus sp. STM2_1]|uniref:Response regulator transcription factor n=1 Tax=Limosilactobacillus rudii TaxID=2759755 RepID=A0A7W3UME4_9LACO|nr:response regulator transcription factor [Limosilactobacillus rudii]MBB1078734.1 response regulator transcription factor [Limosilactobacillus rudii]MBB1098166.1 response regulator transcription factor [Limosilactobacillus rudii]MCD7135238.1 response regulator transcription factor [Limosilactobacillus rudii]